jgi:polyisoprenoid-binding protein YceI
MSKTLYSLTVALALAAGVAQTPAQTVNSAASELVFVTRQMGVPVEGRFQRWSAQVALDPRKPEAAQVVLRIQMDSVAFAAPEVTAEAQRPVWLDTAKFPQAVFQSKAIRPAGNGRYEMTGSLTLKGESHEMVVPVTLAQNGSTRHRERQLHGQAQRLPHRRGRVDRRQPGGPRGAGALPHRAVRACPPRERRHRRCSVRCWPAVLLSAVAARMRARRTGALSLRPDAHVRALRGGRTSTRRRSAAASARSRAMPRSTAPRARAACRWRSTPRSVSTGVPPLDARLKEGDMLSVGANPRAYLVAERVEFDDAGRVTALRGEFTMRGTSVPLTLTALRFNCYTSPLLRREVCGGDFEGRLSRSPWASRTACRSWRTPCAAGQVEAVRDDAQ